MGGGHKKQNPSEIPPAISRSPSENAQTLAHRADNIELSNGGRSTKHMQPNVCKCVYVGWVLKKRENRFDFEVWEKEGD